MLKKVVPIIPPNGEVVLLGDAAYDPTDMLTWVAEEPNWHAVMRTSPQMYGQTDRERQAIGDHPLQKGQIFVQKGVGFTQEAGLVLNVIGWWSSRDDGPLYLVTNLANGSYACKYYRRRFQIETFFSDQKSRGFHIHKSHLANPARLGRLLLAACLAYLWVICQGSLVIAEEKTGQIDRTDRIDKSLFRLGLDWIYPP